jgi:hypothetical protein
MESVGAINHRCAQCAFYHKLDQHPVDAGRCRRYAPKPGELERTHKQWPLVYAYDWCGEFVRGGWEK